jgi:hypothetical protein
MPSLLFKTGFIEFARLPRPKKKIEKSIPRHYSAIFSFGKANMQIFCNLQAYLLDKKDKISKMKELM